ncbi:hypothetical protein [Limosilactobacillus reuteri]|uniref:hypothetical protein n=1 Tax=Limosilactobacillus reuteri TaxID=1598 RepID=UPI001CDBEF04|nr:hypothetical protein [Limosilactobacillus reuteri]
MPTTPNRKMNGGSSNMSNTLFGGGVKLPALCVKIKYAASPYVSNADISHM